MSKKSKEKITNQDKQTLAADENVSVTVEEYVKQVRRTDMITIAVALVVAFLTAFGIILLSWQLHGQMFKGYSTITQDNLSLEGYDSDAYAEWLESAGEPDYIAGDPYLNDGDINTSGMTDAAEEASEDLTSPFIGEDDIVHFLGGSFYELQKRFSSSEQIVTQVSHYFVDEYLGVSYDKETGEILTLENDGPGRMPITLAGVSIGMKFSEVDEMLSEAGIDFYPSEDYDEASDILPMKFSAGVDDMRFEATVEFEDNTVTDIICKCKYR